MNTTETTPSTRLGKIARMPFQIRLKLNERLEDNEPSQRLVKWLNSLPEVQEILEALFDSRPISEQNLSVWKQGGFRDWQRNQETRVAARVFLDEAAELEEEIYFAKNGDDDDHTSMLDRVADRMALSLLQLFREAELGEKGQQRTRTMLDAARELSRLRRGDHQRRYAELAEKRRQSEIAEAEKTEKEARQKKAEDDNIFVRTHALYSYNRYIRGLAEGTLSPRDKKQIEEFFADDPEALLAEGITPLPEGEELAEIINEMRAYLRKQGRRGVPEDEGEKDNDTEESDAEDVENEGESSPVKAGQG